jgi:uncharacterized membrane protein
MGNYKQILLGLLVFFTGLYAGQMFHEMIGAQQALSTLDAHTYIAYWQSLDKLMHVRMPVASNLVLVVFIINLITLYVYKNNFAYVLLVASFVFLVSETIVTGKLQLPVNAMVQSLDLNHLPASVEELKSSTMVHFITRAVLRFIAIILLLIATFNLVNSNAVRLNKRSQY